MSTNSLLWQLAYQLCGITTVGRTHLEPLGSLPVPLRRAVLEVAHDIAPLAVNLKLASKQLLNTADPGRPNYTWVEGWRFAREELKDFVENTKDGAARYTFLEDYLDRHALAKPKDDRPDEHYADRIFLQEAFLPVFGLAGLSLLNPQYTIRETTGRKRRVDFLLFGGAKYAFEVEAFPYQDAFRVDDRQLDETKQMQMGISGGSIIYKQFSLNNIRKGDAKTRLQDLALSDPILRDLVRPDKEQRAAEEGLSLFYLQDLLGRFPLRYQLYQEAALTILWNAVSQNKKRIVVVDWSPNLALLPVSLLDTVSLVERAARLYGLEVELPQIDIHIVGQYDQHGVHEVLAKYLGTESVQADQRADASQAAVNIHFSPELPLADYLFAGESADPCPFDHCISADSLERFSAEFRQIARAPLPFDLTVKDTEPQLLDYFARRYFLVPELKEKQLELLRKALNQESVLGILPSGYGKSLVYWLYALLIPRPTLVINPLRRLIRDQIQNLNRQGLRFAESVTSGDNKASRALKYKALRNHRHRLLYISPDRLRIKDFCTEIATTLANSPAGIGALVVDEAHCISELGHDFRPSYLQIERFREAIEAATGHDLPAMMAFTSTASPEVRKEILRALGMDQDCVVQKESSDRPNLSLSVWEVDPKDSNAKPEMLKHLLAEVMPKALGIPFEKLLPADGGPPYEHAGVIFGAYAAPTEAEDMAEGVHFIARRIAEDLTKDQGLVKVHTPRSPLLCPFCGSATMIRDKTGDPRQAAKAAAARNGSWTEGIQFRCLDCGRAVRKREAKEDAVWEEKISSIQDEFNRSEFPLLVATEDYGIGVDKRNIRFIIHHSFPSGLDGYYQQAGRAGHDGGHAHVALMYAPPEERCERDYLGKSPPRPPCVSGGGRCPYNLPALCDYGRQAQLIERSYGGIEVDLERIIKIYQRLDQRQEILLRGQIDSDAGDDEHRSVELALYRLQQLGLVENYSLRYIGQGEIGVDVEFNKDWTREQIVNRLMASLSGYEGAEKYLDEARGLLAHSLNSSKKAFRGEDFISQAAQILLKQVYDTVLPMRYEMLAALMRYAKGDGEQNRCRRIALRSIFDDTKHLIDSNYRCNFCDSCVPDLRFPSTAAEMHLFEWDLDEIARRMPAYLDKFDIGSLNQILAKIVEKGGVNSLLAQVARRLEQRYSDPAALYAAGVLRLQQGEAAEATRYLREGFRSALQQERSEEDLLAFYQEGARANAREAFSWLTKVEGAWDSQEGLRCLVEEAFRSLGTDSEEFRLLFALWRIRRYGEILEDAGMVLQRIEGIGVLG
jgi:ATP-dependent DNA helicase RecQ